MTKTRQIRLEKQAAVIPATAYTLPFVEVALIIALSLACATAICFMKPSTANADGSAAAASGSFVPLDANAMKARVYDGFDAVFPDLERAYHLDIMEDGTQRFSNRATSAPQSVELKTAFDVTTLRTSPIVHFNVQGNPPAVILYLHGGSYLNEPGKNQWRLLDRLCTETGAYAVMPLYPLAPEHTYEDAYELVDDVYKRLVNEYGANRIVLMGDSAGGGLAAGFAEYLLAKHATTPRDVVLISPWVDITMDNPEIDWYASSDTMLDADYLREAGRAWAGKTDTSDWHVSPLNGNVEGFPRTTIFVGSEEMFEPDIKLFATKLWGADVDCDFYDHEGMQHVYPLRDNEFSGDAFGVIVNAINNR